MDKRKEFIKGLSGALAGAALLTGAVGCNLEKPEESHMQAAKPSQGVGREPSIEEKIAQRLEKLNYSEMLNVLKEMYVNIDKARNPESDLKAEDLEIYYKTNQTSCFYVESKDAIVLNGQDAWSTEHDLNKYGYEYRNVGIKGQPMIIIVKDGKTIDGIGTIKYTDKDTNTVVNIDEAPITTPELLNTISADGKTTSQEIPQEIWSAVLTTAINYLKEPDQYSIQVKVPEACEKISELLTEYGLQGYLPDNLLPIDYTIEDKLIDDEGR